MTDTIRQDTTEKTGSSEETSARLLDLVAEMAAEVSPAAAPAQVHLDQSLERELGFDSLARMELLHRVEREFGVTLPDRVLSEADTPRDLLRGLGAKVAPSRATFSMPEQVSQPVGERRTLVAEHIEALTDVLAWQAENQADVVHIRLYDEGEDGQAITFGSLHDEAAKLASGLIELGLAADETVVLMLPTGRDYFVSFMGVLLAGGVPVPVYPPGRPSQLEEHLRRHTKIAINCNAAIMITDPAAMRLSRLISSLIPSLRHFTTVADIEARSTEARIFPVRTATDTAFIQYTSGSTGDPKGVVLSNANLLANIRAMGQALKAHPDDVFISWLPLYHDMGLIGAWLGSLVHGIPLIIMSPLTFLARPHRWLQAIHRYRGTISGAPNFAYEACVQRISDADLEGLDLSSWRVAFNGAEPISVATLEAFCDKFAKYGFRREAMMPAYGLAENSVGVTFPPFGRGPLIDAIDRDELMLSGHAVPIDPASPKAQRLPSCGQALPGHQVRVVDTAGRELPDRREGRIQFTGPSATSGYLHKPEITATLFDGEWLNTGDVGYIADAELYITGRAKDMIIKAGRNIFPAELEDAVGGLDGIQRGNVAVFGSRGEKEETERLIVLAETRLRDDDRQTKLRQAINALAVDLVGTAPDDIMLTPPRSVPKTSSGKIRRAAARVLYESGEAGVAAPSLRRQMIHMTLAALPGFFRRFRRDLSDRLYAGWALLVLWLVAVPAWVIAVLSPSRRFALATARMALTLIRAVTALPIHVEGLENLPREGGCVITANHSSYLDGPILLWTLSKSLHGRLKFVAKGELARQKIAGPFLRRLGTEFVERFDARQSVADADRLIAAVGAGETLMFFPEGTLSRMPGLLPFQTGAFSAAISAGTSVVPVVIRGSRAALRGDSHFIRRVPIRVIILPPMSPPPLPSSADETTRWRTAVQFRDQVRAEILRHSGEPDLAHERVKPEENSQ